MSSVAVRNAKANCIDKRHCEIIGGKKYMPPSPSLNHNRIIFSLYDVFKDILRGRDFEFYSEPVDVILNEKDRPMPDFTIVSDSLKLSNGKNIQGAPDFIAEVLSPSNSAHDLITKRNLYEKHGVREYWIVDIQNRNIHVYTLKDGIYGAPDIYHCFTDEDIREIEQGYDDDDKEQIKITHIESHTFGEQVNVPINKIFENIK